MICHKDDRYVVFSGTEYAVLSETEYAVLILYDVLDRKLDTPFPMEVDTPSGKRSIRRIESLQYGVLGISWSRDHAQIRRIFLDGYGVLGVRTVIFKYLRLSSKMRMERDLRAKLKKAANPSKVFTILPFLRSKIESFKAKLKRQLRSGLRRSNKVQHQLPTKEKVDALSKELRSRATIPGGVYTSSGSSKDVSHSRPVIPLIPTSLSVAALWYQYTRSWLSV
ncbi:hypothetical protein Tco_1182274 [Tanacetum coccineum]